MKKLFFSILMLFCCSFLYYSFSQAQNATKTAFFPQDRSSETAPEVLPQIFSQPNKVDIKNDAGINWDCNNVNDPFRRKILATAHQQFLNWPRPSMIQKELVESLKINRLESKHIDFYTDFPLNPFIKEIPLICDEAVAQLCQYFGIDENELSDWRIEAFLMKSKEPFQKLGALDRVPNFPHGYSTGSRIFAMDHNVDYYNRFLLLHELVHAFMYRIFGDLNPRWFSEGMAEYLGLHSWENQHLTLGIVPRDEKKIEGFGRLRLIREKVQTDQIPSLQQILNFVPVHFNDVETYAWSWAFVLFLDRHPEYQLIRQKMAFYMMFPNANQLFLNEIGGHWEKLENDWKSFLSSFDYGFDFRFVQCDFASGKPFEKLDESKILTFSANQNWQNSGLYLEKSKAYRVTAKGRFTVVHPRKTVPCEPNGITFDYYHGRPWGQLFAVIIPDIELNVDFATYYSQRRLELQQLTNGNRDISEKPKIIAPTSVQNLKNKTAFLLQDSLFPWNKIIAFDPTTQTIVPEVSGTLYFKLNVPVSSLVENQGTFNVRIQNILTNSQSQ